MRRLALWILLSALTRLLLATLLSALPGLLLLLTGLRLARAALLTPLLTTLVLLATTLIAGYSAHSGPKFVRKIGSEGGKRGVTTRPLPRAGSPHFPRGR
jgi:membrane protein implicated in regulation of membrane protease activity